MKDEIENNRTFIIEFLKAHYCLLDHLNSFIIHNALPKDSQDAYQVVSNNNEIRVYLPKNDNRIKYLSFSKRDGGKGQTKQPRLDVSYNTGNEHFGGYGSVRYGVGTIVSSNLEATKEAGSRTEELDVNLLFKKNTQKGFSRTIKTFFGDGGVSRSNAKHEYCNARVGLEELRAKEPWQDVEGDSNVTMRNMGDSTLEELLKDAWLGEKILSTQRRFQLAINLLKSYEQQVPSNYIHRDLKPDNVMCTENNKINYIDPGHITPIKNGTAYIK